MTGVISDPASRCGIRTGPAHLRRSPRRYPHGGFGEATWTGGGGKWAIKTTARMADGKKVTATNILTRTDDDHVTWQLTGLTVDGKSLPDPQPVKMKRVNPAQP